MPKGFYKLFNYKPTTVGDVSKPVESDQAFLSMQLNSVVQKTTGEEYKKVGNKIFDKNPRQIASINDVTSSFAALDSDNIFTKPNVFDSTVTMKQKAEIGQLTVNRNLTCDGNFTSANATVSTLNIGNTLASPSANVTTVMSSTVSPTANNSGNLGTSTQRWGHLYANQIHGTMATTGADLAERYDSIEDIKAGTVLGMSENGYVIPYDGNAPYAGVVTTIPGIVLNGDYEGMPHVDVALKGQVPVFCVNANEAKPGMYLIAEKTGSSRAYHRENITPEMLLDVIGIVYKVESTDYFDLPSDMVIAKI